MEYTSFHRLSWTLIDTREPKNISDISAWILLRFISLPWWRLKNRSRCLLTSSLLSSPSTPSHSQTWPGEPRQLVGHSTQAMKDFERPAQFFGPWIWQFFDWWCPWDFTFYQVVPGTRRGGSFEKGTWLIGIHGELEKMWIEMKWNEIYEMRDMNEFTWINWREGIETVETNELTHELKRMNRHEWIDMSELTWVNWHEGIEMNDLTWMNWN